MVNESRLDALRAATAYDVHGDKIGAVGDVWLDDATGEPTWITVVTGLFGGKRHFAPMKDAVFSGDQVTLAYSKDAVLGAPAIHDDEHLGQLEESELNQYYYRVGTDPQVPTDPGQLSGDYAHQIGDVLRTDRPAGDFIDETDLDTLYDDAGRMIPSGAGPDDADNRLVELDEEERP